LFLSHADIAATGDACQRCRLLFDKLQRGRTNKRRKPQLVSYLDSLYLAGGSMLALTAAAATRYSTFKGDRRR